MEQIGTLVRLRRYPVKGMAGEDLEAARVTYAGLVGDRVYAFVDKASPTDFPWMTSRKGRDMILFRPRFLAPAPPGDGIFSVDYATEVTTPEGQKARVDDPEFTRFLEQRYGRALELRHSERNMTDAYPVSVLGLATIGALGEETEMKLNPLRFRANFYVQWSNSEPFFEDQFVGRQLRIGENVSIHIVKKDGRCVIITLDPETAAPSPVVLEKVARGHAGCMGVYGAVLREGIVRTNDPVYAV
ncbi:MAG: MOSC N-terminal beta barrel domain-containing protein [Candidatus Acidiferrales bacterium]